jgi:membrane protein DedA with SNARE-associated domain
MITINFLQHFVEMYAIGAYLLIFLGVIIEGEVVVILAGIFSHLGSINIFSAFIATVLGGVTKSTIGYTVGYYLEKHHSKRVFMQRTESKIAYFLPNFSRKPFWSIFISRFFILGLNWFALIYSGYKKVNLRTYIKAEVASLILWSVIMLALGSIFSYTALSVGRDVRKFLGLLLLFFIAFFIVERIVSFVLEIVTGVGRVIETEIQK